MICKVFCSFNELALFKLKLCANSPLGNIAHSCQLLVADMSMYILHILLYCVHIWHPWAEGINRPWRCCCFTFLAIQIYISSYPDALFCRISVTFVDKDGEEKHLKVPIGMSMLEAAHENDIELEGRDLLLIKYSVLNLYLNFELFSPMINAI